MSVPLSLFHPQCAFTEEHTKLSLMDNFSYVIIFIFTLLSSVSSSSFSRRHLLQTDPSTLSPPFFPLYNSSSSSSPPPSPPQPLPPPAPATFPANISALVLPRSPTQHTPSRTLLIPAISAVLAVATLVGLALFLYSRWRVQTRSHVKESSVSSDISQSEKQTEKKLSVAPSTSEILYLGNVVTSADSRFVKPESPDISPLPPLPPRSLPNLDQEEEEEEDEDFYSPLTSIAGQESRDRRINPYSNCSCSISSDSPAMSPNQNPQSPSPKRTVRKSNKRYGGTSMRMFSVWNQNLGFPRISSASTSPERGGNNRTPDAYARSSMYSSVSTTPERFFRKVLDSSPPRWNDLRQNVKSLFLSSTSASPTRDFCINVSEKKPELDHTIEQNKSAACTLPPPQRPPPPMPEPPPLVPPSQSFMAQKSGKKLSFSELPQGSWEVKTERSKPKLKPLPWDKVRASSRRTATWDRLPYNSSNTNSRKRSLSCDLPMLNQESKVLDPKKRQNVEILLSTLKLTTNDVFQALLDGHYDALGAELLQSLSDIAPSEEEEKKLISYSDDSVNKLAPSERFLKELFNVPFVFKRVNALLTVASFDSKVEYLKRSFGDIQAACEELRKNRMLLKLVGATLEIGLKSRDPRAFKLEALLKLANIKSLDGRTSILQSVVQNITESEGIKGLQVVRNLSSVLDNVKKSAELDYAVLKSNVSKLYEEVQKIREVLLLCEETGHNEEHQWWKFRESMTRFIETATDEIKKVEGEECSTLFAVKKITEYFNLDSAKDEAEQLKVFVIIRDFLNILDGVCKKMEVTREEITLA